MHTKPTFLILQRPVINTLKVDSSTPIFITSLFNKIPCTNFNPLLFLQRTEIGIELVNRRDTCKLWDSVKQFNCFMGFISSAINFNQISKGRSRWFKVFNFFEKHTTIQEIVQNNRTASFDFILEVLFS